MATDSVLRPGELKDVLLKEIEAADLEALDTQEVGSVLEVKDGTARVYGLLKAMAGEMLEFTASETGDTVVGLALNLEEDNLGAVILGDYLQLKEGDEVRCTGRVLQVPVGDALDQDRELLEARVHGPRHRGTPTREGATADGAQGGGLDDPDRAGPAGADHRRPRYRQDGHRSRHDHQPAGRGRHLRLRGRGTEDAADPAPMQYIAPYAGCAMAEHFMYKKHRHTLCIYDDLSKHAQAYRQLSLVLRRPPGREAYPGDVFYLHSRLLERAAKLSEVHGGGSLTALPVIETQAGDVSAYIPTNVISITDGQIYLESRCLAWAATRRSRP
jgi:F-type H+-transporting ATPase subunit alpha